MIVEAVGVIAAAACHEDARAGGIGGEGGLVEAAGEGGEVIEDIEAGAGEAEAGLHEADELLAAGELAIGLSIVNGGGGREEAVGGGGDVLVVARGGGGGEVWGEEAGAGLLGGGVVAPADEHIDLGGGEAELGEIGIGQGGFVGALGGGGGGGVAGDVCIEEAALVVDGVGVALDYGVWVGGWGDDGGGPLGGVWAILSDEDPARGGVGGGGEAGGIIGAAGDGEHEGHVPDGGGVEAAIHGCAGGGGIWGAGGAGGGEGGAGVEGCGEADLEEILQAACAGGADEAGEHIEVAGGEVDGARYGAGVWGAGDDLADLVGIDGGEGGLGGGI